MNTIIAIIVFTSCSVSNFKNLCRNHTRKKVDFSIYIIRCEICKGVLAWGARGRQVDADQWSNQYFRNMGTRIKICIFLFWFPFPFHGLSKPNSRVKLKKSRSLLLYNKIIVEATFKPNLN